MTDNDGGPAFPGSHTRVYGDAADHAYQAADAMLKAKGEA